MITVLIAVIVVTISACIAFWITELKKDQKILVEKLRQRVMTELYRREEVVKFIKSELEKRIDQIRQKGFRSVCFVKVSDRTNDFEETKLVPEDFRIIEVYFREATGDRYCPVRFTMEWSLAPGYLYTLEIDGKKVHNSQSVLASLGEALHIASGRIERIPIEQS